MLKNMRLSKNSQDGFSPVETVIVFAILILVVALGAYLAHLNHKPAPTPKPKTSELSANTFAQPVSSLSQAVTQATNVYNEYQLQALSGGALNDNSTWAANNKPAAEDLQFINKYSSWFTSAFEANANSYKTNGTVPPAGRFLICESDVANLEQGSFYVVGSKLSGKTANLILYYSTKTSQTSPITNHKLPITAKFQSNKTWEIDSVDLSGCGK